MTAKPAVAALDAGAVAALSVPHGIFALKEEQRTAANVFSWPSYCSGDGRDSAGALVIRAVLLLFFRPGFSEMKNLVGFH